MRIVVMSDSHRRTNAILEIIERHKDNADLFLFCGDGNDDLDEALMIYKDIKIDRVSGNCDFSSPYPSQKIIEFNKKKILFTHGHPFYVKHGYTMIEEFCEKNNIDYCFFGHTHTPYTSHKGKTYYMNPGSCRDGYYGVVDMIDNSTNMYITDF